MTMEPKTHYFNREYLRRERLLAYVDQISLVTKYADPGDSILEIGKGNGYLAHFLCTYLNHPVSTLDISPELEPDICADITDPDFQLDQLYDLGLCFEVFEHIPWEKLSAAAENIKRWVKKYVLISVPDTNYFLQPRLTMFGLRYRPFNLVLTFPRWFRNNKTLGKGHEWEIGIKNDEHRITPRKLIREVFGEQALVSHFRGREFPGHHFFVLKGRGSNEGA